MVLTVGGDDRTDVQPAEAVHGDEAAGNMATGARLSDRSNEDPVTCSADDGDDLVQGETELRP